MITERLANDEQTLVDQAGTKALRILSDGIESIGDWPLSFSGSTGPFASSAFSPRVRQALRSIRRSPRQQ